MSLCITKSVMQIGSAPSQDEMGTVYPLALIYKATQAEAVLAAFSGRKPCEFQDIVLATPVMRIGAQNREDFGVDTSQFWMLSIEAT
jgi:hypothetical protein